MINASVLIVEHNEMFRKILKRSLIIKYPNLRVFEAENTSKTLEILQTNPTDLVIMDVHLPDGNGFHLTEKIKRQHPKTAVFIITNHDSIEYRETACKYGADGFLSKRASPLNAIIKTAESLCSLREGRTPPVERNQDKTGQ